VGTVVEREPSTHHRRRLPAEQGAELVTYVRNERARCAGTGKAAQGSSRRHSSIVRRMSSMRSIERSSIRGSGWIGINRVERLDATSSTRRRRRR